MGETALIPVCFHATTIANEVLGRLIDKKCGCFSKINAAKSAGKERFRRIKGASAHYPRSKRAFRSEFRVYAAKGGECPEPPEGGTPNGGNARMRPRIDQAEMSC
jgi:hypothetical protein